LNNLFFLHNLGFEAKKRKYGESSFSGDKIKRFHYDIVRNFLDQNWLKLYSMGWGEKLIGSLPVCFQIQKFPFPVPERI